MKYSLMGILFVFLLLMVSSYKINSSSNINKSKLKLLWSDEFDKAGAPDPLKWGFDIGTGSDGWGNQELEYYTDDIKNAFIENGILKVRAIKENYKGSAYTSARLLSKGKFEFKYGRVEIRAKMPKEVGTWPAFWMMGNDLGKVSWPDCGEIDIVEHRGSEPNNIVAALHYPGRSGGNCNRNSILIKDVINDFHIYRLDWSSTSIQIFVDDKLFHVVPNSPEMPFNKDFFLLLNLAIGGGFGGPVDSTFTSSIYEIDYIRVYK